MNTWTIARRLRATLAMIIVLLLAALGLAWWLEGRIHQDERNAAARHDQIKLSSARIHYALLQMSEALRDVADLSAGGRDVEDVTRKTTADADLDKVLGEMAALAVQYPELRMALTAVKDYHDRTLNPLEDQIVELVKTDKAAAKDAYTPEPKQSFYRPSVDAFFESLVRHWRDRAAGVLLTGMGRDGARGLKAMRDAGYHTVAQDEASCAVYGMPKAAAQMKSAVEVLPLDRIADALDRFVRNSIRKGRGSP